MSRSRAKNEISAEALTEAMGDRSWQRESAADLVDEAPDAYKPIDQIMADQTDLVRVRHSSHQVFNYKGVDRGRGNR